jgi:hypothetical protein
MSLKQNKRFTGLLLAAMGTILTVGNWQLAFYDGRFYPQVAIAGPTFIILGLGSILFPHQITTITGQRANINQLDGSDLKTTLFRLGIFVIALGSGFLNLAVLKVWFP